MLSNKDIWDVNNNKDDTNVFYHKIEEFKKGRGLTNKLSKQLEDYNDDLDEKVDVMKTDHIQQLSNNECKLNNLRQINCISNNKIHNPYNNCVSIKPNCSNTVYDFNPIAQAIYFTPQQKQIKLNVANEIMNVSIVPRQLRFASQNNDCENTKTHSPNHWNSYKQTIVFQNSKFDSPYQACLNNSQVKTSFNAKQCKEQSRVKYNQTNHSNSLCPSTGVNEAVSQKINIEDIIIGKDKRTTLMLRNIPNKYTLNNILEEISSSFWGKYDYINLPIDIDRKLNLGYAFINFTDPFHIIGFYDAYRSRKWLKHKSDKKMDMNYADKQGKRENNGKDIQSNYFAEEDKRFNLSALQIKTEIPVVSLLLLIFFL